MSISRQLRAPKDELELTHELAAAPEVGLLHAIDDPRIKELIKNSRGHTEVARSFHPFAMAINDIHSMPLLMGHDCRMERKPAEALQLRSRRLREHLGGTTDPSALRRLFLRDGDRFWQVASAVPTLEQMLQAEKPELRRFMVEWLAKIDGREASEAIARRAVFDVAGDVRLTAVEALRSRPKSEFRDVLLAAMRHPWPAAAEFAADALVKLRIPSAVPSLVALLDEPAPAATFAVTEDGRQTQYVREIVRVNHLKNCIVCHALSSTGDDFVRAAAPDPKAKLPPTFSPVYYGPPRPVPGFVDQRIFIRADVTYLRQDFSLVQPVADAGPWPGHQRFDYFVRTRQLSASEAEEHRRTPSAHPQRDEVLFALRELTGEDRGDKRSDWEPIAKRY